MYLDYLPPARDLPDAPMLRFYDADRAEIEALHAAALDLASGTRPEVRFDQLPGVVTPGGAEFEGKLAQRSDRIREVAPNRFLLTLDSEGWLHMADLIAPFLDRPGGFQWLNYAFIERMLPDSISLLLSPSPDGRW